MSPLWGSVYRVVKDQPVALETWVTYSPEGYKLIVFILKKKIFKYGLYKSKYI